ncbi:MAG: NAD-dependent epimerase/dehydratase family protein [Actinomycetes bacterium]
MGFTVAVTGPSGEIGIAAVAALEADPDVDRIIGMARRPFDPASRGWTKTEYRQGDIVDRDSVDRLVSDADVLVHLAYVIFGNRSESRRVNLTGTRNVFEAAVAAPAVRRLVYTSSVAAYGYHDDNPQPLTEDVPARGSHAHYYSEQKAECEALLAELTAGSTVETVILRPCIVAGPLATALADSMPWRAVADRLPSVLRRSLSAVPWVRPVLPSPDVPLQLVHHDDVASAIAAAVTARNASGPYNLAGDGVVSIAEVARALGAVPLPIPSSMVTVAADMLARLPMVPAQLEWLQSLRIPVLMDTARAKRDLAWRPAYTSAATLDALASASGQ